MLELNTKALTRCLRSANRAGFDPYNSHAAQSARWTRAWKDKARRSK